ncbi:MAG: hypothetical protein BWK79_16915 [Beggiatoa sp. IS2]|nr:MAG: hypothetical protein BWK79_16915 [Beggiatoa sp. IS2]
MYTAYFGLNAAPFAIIPDPQYLYLSERHREALAHLLYGVSEGLGFVLLTGEVGTGKTTLCHCLVRQLPDTVDVVMLSNPRVSPLELLTSLFDELRIAYDSSFTLKDFTDTLNTYLLTGHAVGRRTVLILDEAQNLTIDVLEQVRLLTNLETTKEKLLHIILVGQPELDKLLKQRNLRQLSQRITARYRLLPLSASDTQAYIQHRLTVSGAHNPLFTKSAIRQVYRYAGGIPRLINIICDRALLGGYVNRKNPVDARIVRKAVQEVRGENLSRTLPPNWAVALLAVTLLIGIVVWWQYPPVFVVNLENAATTKALSLPNDTKPAPVTATKPVPTAPAVSLRTTAELRDLLKNPKIPSDLASAQTVLLQQWQLDYSRLMGNGLCERAATEGLACSNQVGDWKDMLLLNRPALIELVLENAEQHHAVVTRLQDDRVTLNFAGQTFELPTTVVGNYWIGQFLLLWRPPALPVPTLKVGGTHDSVLWVRKRLNKIEGRASDPQAMSARFDPALKLRIIAFQRHQGLPSDGMIGEKTLILLSTLAGEEPLIWQFP